MVIVAAIVLNNGFFCSMGVSWFFICKYDFTSILFLQTVMFRKSCSCNALRILANSYLFFMNFSYIIGSCLNICITLDLVFTLRNSFSNPYHRTRLYFLFSILYGIVGVLIIQNSDFDQRCPHTMTVVLGIKTLFFIVAIPSLFYVAYRLSRPGLSY